jgi:hypothetical protein
MKQYIGIIRDHSMSMRHIAKTAMDDYNTLIADIKKNAIEKDIDTIISVMECGVRVPATSGFEPTINRLTVQNSSVLGIKPISTYEATGSNTPLYDAVGALVDHLSKVPDANDPETSFLLMVLTDGGENASKSYTEKILRGIIHDKQMTDRWSFTFRVPNGQSWVIQHSLGIPSSNIMEWDTSEDGLRQATVVTTSSVGEYYTARATGSTSTRSFYQTDMSSVSSQKVKSSLQDITDDVDVLYVPLNMNGIAIREFVESNILSTMKKGSAFYQLTKKEDEVQDYKQILIMDKKTKKIYGGVHARQLLNLPFTGTVKIVPGVHGNYDIFIQSTSVNRKLVGGTSVLYWDAVGEEYKEPKKVSTQPLKLQQKSEHDWFVEGYRAGFASGKAKSNQTHVIPNKFYQDGFDLGYKHGKGKKKNLYK